MSHVDDILTDIYDMKQFDALIGKKRKLPLVLDFWSTSCAPCLALLPTLRAMQQKYEGKVIVCKCNVMDLPELAGRFMVSSLPTTMIFKVGSDMPFEVIQGVPDIGELDHYVWNAISESEK